MLELIITSSILILAILALRLVFKKTISRKLQYALWLLVVIRLVLPFSISSPISVMNGLDTSVAESYLVSGQFEVSFENSQPALGNDTDIVAKKPSIPPIDYVKMIWILGAIAVGTWFFASNLVFSKKLKKSLRRLDTYESKLPVYIADDLSSPCLFGFLRPAIYITQSIAESEKKLKHVATHELCHYKQLDHLWAIIRVLLVSVYWFNPLVWVAAICSKTDCELSCDETAIKMLGEDERLAYGKTLVDLIEVRATSSRFALTATTMALSKSGIKKRISAIVSSKRTVAIALVALLAVTALVIGCTFTGSKKMNAEQAVQSLYNSIKYEDEKIIFTIPQEYATPSDFNLMIYGRTVATNSGIMSVHLLEEENTNKAWESGKTYQIDHVAKNYLELNMSIFMHSDESVEKEMNLLETLGIEPHTNALETKAVEDAISLTKETATDFINQTLSSLVLSSDNTVSFTLPTTIPTDEDGKTKLIISSSATFSPEPGTSSVQEILDWKDGWQGGEVYTEKLDMSRGKLTRIFLRVAFITEEREYAANYIEFVEPFKYDSPVNIANKGVEINQTGTSSILKYKMQNGESFSVAFTLPKGITLSAGEKYSGYVESTDADFPSVVAVKNGAPIGGLVLSGFGTNDRDVLTKINTADKTLPMAIFSPIALSNHAQFDNYKVCKSSATGANATADYLWQDLTGYEGRAPDAPWLKSNSILAYDYEKAPYLIYWDFNNNALSTAELETLAKSISITN